MGVPKNGDPLAAIRVRERASSDDGRLYRILHEILGANVQSIGLQIGPLFKLLAVGIWSNCG